MPNNEYKASALDDDFVDDLSDDDFGDLETLATIFIAK